MCATQLGLLLIEPDSVCVQLGEDSADRHLMPELRTAAVIPHLRLDT